MYNTFLYIVSNDGVDTSSSYPFKGKVTIVTLYVLFMLIPANKLINHSPCVAISCL